MVLQKMENYEEARVKICNKKYDRYNIKNN